MRHSTKAKQLRDDLAAAHDENRQLKNLLHAWLHYEVWDDSKANSKDGKLDRRHFPANWLILRAHTVQALGAPAKLIATRDPLNQRIEVPDFAKGTKAR